MYDKRFALGAWPVRASEGSSQLIVLPYEYQWAIALANTVIFDLTSIASRDIVTAGFCKFQKVGFTRRNSSNMFKF